MVLRHAGWGTPFTTPTAQAIAWHGHGRAGQPNAGEQALAREPHWVAHLLSAISYAQMNRLDDAQRHAREVLRSDPTFSLPSYAALRPYKNEADLDHEFDDLRKAGLLEE